MKRLITLLACLLSICCLNYNAQASLVDGLIAYYPFNGGSAADMSGNGNDGTIVGSLATTTDRFGTQNAYLFDPGEYISISENSSQDLSGSFSISLWIKINSVSGDQFQYAFGNMPLPNPGGFIFYLNNSVYPGVIYYSSANGQWYNSAPDSLGVGQWKHLAITSVYTGSSRYLKFYINGSLVETLNPTERGDISSDSGLKIGYNLSGVSLDDIRLYNRILSDAEISDLANDRGETVTYIDTDTMKDNQGNYTSETATLLKNENGTLIRIYDTDEEEQVGNDVILFDSVNWIPKSIKVIDYNNISVLATNGVTKEAVIRVYTISSETYNDIEVPYNEFGCSPR